MKITIFGSGYVGLVTAACFAEAGNEVLCMDIDASKIDALKQGIVPIYEPGLELLIAQNSKSSHLRFTCDAQEAVAHGELQFIAVGTPASEDGAADLQYVLEVAGCIGKYMDSHRLVINKSTVPVGTSAKVSARISQELTARGSTCTFAVASNPEFLKEGSAIADFMKPDRIIVGTDSDDAIQQLRQLYAPFNRHHERFMPMDARSAELTKYAANAMLATKISFINEIANIADRLGADIEQVRRGIGADNRIGYSFIYPGCGYGGSCFPKDIKALLNTAEQADYHPQLLQAVERVNDQQKTLLFQKINTYFDQQLSGKIFALWGLAFKPKTDDIRCAPSRTLIDALLAAGAKVQAYDPIAMPQIRRAYTHPNLSLHPTETAALQNACALAITTDCKQFTGFDIPTIKQSLTTPTIFDGRNLYDPLKMNSIGINYFAIGRGKKLQ